MGNERRDIENEDDIILLIDSFYAQVAKDEILVPVFNKALGDNWDHHMPVMYRFWSTLLLGGASYQGNPFLKHVPLELNAVHFDKWLSLFKSTVDGIYEGELAEEAKNRANSISYIFQSKLGLVKGV